MYSKCGERPVECSTKASLGDCFWRKDTGHSNIVKQWVRTLHIYICIYIYACSIYIYLYRFTILYYTNTNTNANAILYYTILILILILMLILMLILILILYNIYIYHSICCMYLYCITSKQCIQWYSMYLQFLWIRILPAKT